MKTLAIALLSLCLLAGCSGDLGPSILAAHKTFDLALDGIHTGHVAGLVTTEQEKSLLPYVKVVDAALKAADAAYLAHASNVKTYLDAAAAGLDQLAKILPTTQPSK